jgi:hypothetical protein
MILAGRSVKFWIFVSLCALVLWTFYFLMDSFNHFLNLSLGLPDWYTGKEWYFLPAFLGIITRFCGEILGLASLMLTWKENKPFREIKSLVVGTLLLETTYQISLLPSSLSLTLRNYYFIGVAYILQVFFTAPFLTILAFKIKEHNESVEDSELLRWVGKAFAGYVAALGVNALSRWLDMLLSEGVTFLFKGLSLLGFLNTLIFMVLAIGLALLGTRRLGKQNKFNASFFVGLSLMSVGIHYMVYVVYSYFVGMLNLVLLIDVWTIPFLGLGLAIATSSRKYGGG